MLIHVLSSILSLLSNYFIYGEFNRSMILTGFGPTFMAFSTLLLVNLLPFLKWPFYLFKWIPYFDSWITPFLMGLSAFITQVLIRKTISETINDVDLQIENIKKNTKEIISPPI